MRRSPFETSDVEGRAFNIVLPIPGPYCVMQVVAGNAVDLLENVLQAGFATAFASITPRVEKNEVKPVLVSPEEAARLWTALSGGSLFGKNWTARIAPPLRTRALNSSP